LVDEDAEAVGEDPLRVVAVLVRVLERAAGDLGALESGEAIRMGRPASRPPDDVELVIVDGQRERLDAQRLAGAVEGAVPALQPAPALDGVHDLLEQLFLLRERLFPAADEEDELAPGILEPFR